MLPRPDFIISERLDPADIEDRYLGHFVELWAAVRGRDRVTRKTSLPPEVIGPAQPDVTLIEVRPDGFWFRQIGSRIRALHARDYRGHSLDEVEPAAFRDTVQVDYRACVRSGVPGYNRIVTRTGGQPFIYERVLLPLSRDGQRVDWLLAIAASRQNWHDCFGTGEGAVA